MSSDSSWTTRLSSFEVGAREHGRAMHEFIHKKFSKGQGSGSSEGEAAGRFCFLEVVPDLIVHPFVALVWPCADSETCCLETLDGL